MSSQEFCYWLQGFFELTELDGEKVAEWFLTPKQTETVRRHLALVFAHDIDPQAGGLAVQTKLNAIHDPKHKVGEVIARC